MTIDPREKVVLFIDGANLYATSKAIGIDIDYRRLLAEFQSKAYLLRAYYYTALVEDQEYSSIRPLIDWLDYNGFTVVTKPAKEFTDGMGRRKIKGSMDIELTVDALEMSPFFDHFVLFSGDGDFTALVAALQRRGKRVTVASTLSTPTPIRLATLSTPCPRTSCCAASRAWLRRSGATIDPPGTLSIVLRRPAFRAPFCLPRRERGAA